MSFDKSRDAKVDFILVWFVSQKLTVMILSLV